MKTDAQLVQSAFSPKTCKEKEKYANYIVLVVTALNGRLV
tara:strand:- start:89 stop:208 length:120 start_codon:yes stop_codon:yes gene_type:complete